MKSILTIIAIAISSLGISQALPFDFEGGPGSVDFVDFDGGTATIEANPLPMGENTSPFVAKIVRDGGAPFSGSKVTLAAPLDFSMENSLSMKVYTTAPVGTPVNFKLEAAGQGPTELVVETTVSGAWETLTWDFSGAPAVYTDVVFMFDLGTVGDGSETSTFYFDDVAQFEDENVLAQLDLPVTFEDELVDYTLIAFEGAVSQLVVDPTDASNMVVETFKPEGATPSGGTTIGTNNGFATLIPISLTDSKMNARVWTPSAGTIVRLKIENSNNNTQTCETDAVTTMDGAWEVLEFDFANEGTGTAALEFGLNNGWVYNKASMFIGFGTAGSASAPVSYFDDIQFGPADGVVDPELDQIDLPVTFEGSTTDYAVSDFGGNSSSLVVDPTDATNMVIESIKTSGSELWAGTTIGTPEGFASDIPFTSDNTKMNVRVWSPTAGIPVRLKVEDSDDDTHTCETQVLTTVAGEWETLEFDFANEAADTPTLAFGLGEGWEFNMASIFFNFDVSGTDEAYYFDDVMFGAVNSIGILDLTNVKAYPNPAENEWIVSTDKTTILSVDIRDITGKQVILKEVKSSMVEIDASLLTQGVYVATIVTSSGTGSLRLIKE
ncbi:MAG: T9SS type A sorting domain-containing protein [Flavobacteriales bacterium]